MIGTRLSLTVAALSLLLLVTAQAQRRDPKVWEYQIWNACGAPQSVDDSKPYSEPGVFHTAPDGSAVLHMRLQFQSAAFAASALEERRLNHDSLSGPADDGGHLELTRLDELPLAFSPGVLVRKVALFWVDGSALHVIYGPSVEHVLVLRRTLLRDSTGVPRQQPN